MDIQKPFSDISDLDIQKPFSDISDFASHQEMISSFVIANVVSS